MSLIERIASSDVPVLITGESGTGKEITAQLIHHLSSPKDGPYLPVNCAAIPETPIESQLFGHEKGAFTGADRRHEGLFESAERLGPTPRNEFRVLRIIGTRAWLWKAKYGGLEISEARRLEHQHPGAASSLREGLEETLTVMRLGLPENLERVLSSINLVENLRQSCSPRCVPVMLSSSAARRLMLRRKPLN